MRPEARALAWKSVTDAARQANADRRTRVLSHPDLARKLTEPPLNYTEPGRWNGYIPPATWREQLNNSPQRAALVAIDTEALRREQEPIPQ